MQPAIGNQSFLDRLVGVIKLDRPTYEGIKRDAAATGQAWIIVLLAGLLSGIANAKQLALSLSELQRTFTGGALVDPETGEPVVDPTTGQPLQLPDLSGLDTSAGRLATIVLSIVSAIIGWYLFAALARWAGRQFFGADADAVSNEEMRRLTGWAYAPALLSVVGIVPVLGPIVALVAAAWAIITQVTAVKTGLNLSTGKAVGTSIVAWIVPGIVFALVLCICLLLAGTLGGVSTTGGS